MATATMNMQTGEWDNSDVEGRIAPMETWDPDKVDANTQVARLHTEVAHQRRDLIELQAQLAALRAKQESDKNEVLAHFGSTRDELLGAFRVGTSAVNEDCQRVMDALDAHEDTSGIDELAYAVMALAAAHGLTVGELRERIARMRQLDEQIAAKILGPLAAPVELPPMPSREEG